MLIFFSIIIFIFGLIIGSFLNVIIFRLNKKQNIIKPRSHCPKCQHQLSFWDLIPVFSFIFLSGKCRYCHKKISIQYPFVELTTSICFLLIFLKYPISNISISQYLNISIYFFFTAILIIIFVYDLKHYLIPNKIVYPALIVTFIVQIIPISQYPNIPISSLIIGSLIPGVFFLILVAVSKERWMGAGDVKLGFLCGLMLGFPNILVALFISFISGAITGLALIIFKHKHLKDKLPYGTFLTASTFLTFLIGDQIINWYLQFLGLS